MFELQKSWKEKEERNRLEKCKDKEPEFMMSCPVWDYGTHIDQDDANTMMVVTWKALCITRMVLENC